MAGIPEAGRERLARMRDKSLFTSDLSVNEFLLVRAAGFEPLGLVVGSSIYHIGFQASAWNRNQEMDVLTQAMYHARELAMTRMEEEAEQLGADGIVAVRLDVSRREWGNDLAEFVAIGTAVRHREGALHRAPNGRPFTSDLSGQDFYTLLSAGYRPVSMVMGTCVYHVAHQGLGSWMKRVGRNVEMPNFTQALYDARELAMERMQAEAEAAEAEGIVGRAARRGQPRVELARAGVLRGRAPVHRLFTARSLSGHRRRRGQGHMIVVTIELGTRLGLNVHRDQWPTAPLLDSYESAGFSWVQVHTPPRPMLADRERCRSHARALRAALAPHGLRLLLHGPDDLSVGTIEHDRAFDGLMDYAAEAGAELVVHHGLAFPVADVGGRTRRARRRRGAVAAALRRSRRGRSGVTIAIENLAPVYPTPAPPRICHDPLAVRDLVRRLDSPADRDAARRRPRASQSPSLRGDGAERAVRAVLDEVVLFDVHDNLGARRHDLGAPGVDPLKLDLHLPPGAGCLPWDRLGPLLADHHAPLLLEVERSHGVAPAGAGHRRRGAAATRGGAGRASRAQS